MPDNPGGELVRAKGLEPPHLAIPEPKSGASTNFATPACPNEAAREARPPARTRERPYPPRAKRASATRLKPEQTPDKARAMTEETPDTAPQTTGSDVPPDHLSVNPRSPHFDAEKLQRGIGIRFKDRVRTDVEEYSISEGWVRVQAGKTLDRKGQPLTIKLTGPVEAWYEDLGENPPVAKKG